MKYRELLELYKKGSLSPEEKEQVENDIEKQEAISDYLFDMDDPDIGELSDLSDLEGQKEDDSEEKFLKLIKKNIRNAFIKTGIAVGAAVLSITLLVIFVLPKAVDKFYYDPNQVMGARDDNPESTTSRMSLDLACYSELFMPQSYRNEVIARENGFGCYDITIPQIAYSPKDTFKTVNGKLERNKLILYDADTLKHPVSNSFIPPANNSSAVSFDMAPQGEPQNAKKALEEKPSDIYGAFVSLKEPAEYEEAVSWIYDKDIIKSGIWCSVYQEGEFGEPIIENIGFKVANGGMCLDWDREKYPILSLLDNSGEYYDIKDGEKMKTHFISLLSYVKDHKEIFDLMGNYHSSNGSYESLISYVENEGLKIHGFYIECEKEDLLKLWEDEKVSYIYTTVI